MIDSLFSMAASITGILTFVAVIFALIYVWYRTLRSGPGELDTIISSVVATIEDIRIMVALGYP